MHEDIAFIDLEASGLGPNSWPIEVGWAKHGDGPVALLIKPVSTWTDAAWDPDAQVLHGIEQSELIEHGRPAREICETLNNHLEGLTVFSDAPDWDGFWLYRLFSSCGLRQRFRLSDFGQLLAELSSETIEAVLREAAKTSPHVHRAAADVQHLQVVFRLVQSLQSD